MALARHVILNTGAKLPVIGLGTWQSEESKVVEAVKVALKSGYRHLDCAWIYGNEKGVAKGIKESGVPRSEIFITTKLWGTSHSPKDVPTAMQSSLDNLGLDYVDLYLIHWPFNFKSNGKDNVPRDENDKVMIDNSFTISDTWKAMEKLVEEGKTKAIGISNFNVPRIEELIKDAKTVPAVNQVELHPYLPQNDLLAYCKSKGIHVTAYSPLGSTNSSLTKEDVIVEIAKKYGKTEAQVLISWGAQRGTSVIPKSVTPERVESNFHDFILEDADMQKINDIHKTKGKRLVDPATFWGLPCFEDDKK